MHHVLIKSWKCLERVVKAESDEMKPFSGSCKSFYASLNCLESQIYQEKPSVAFFQMVFSMRIVHISDSTNAAVDHMGPALMSKKVSRTIFLVLSHRKGDL